MTTPRRGSRLEIEAAEAAERNRAANDWVADLDTCPGREGLRADVEVGPEHPPKQAAPTPESHPRTDQARPGH